MFKILLSTSIRSCVFLFANYETRHSRSSQFLKLLSEYLTIDNSIMIKTNILL